MEGGKEKAAEPILITFSAQDIDRIYWRFFWNSVLLGILLSVGGFCLMVFITIASMRHETRPSRSSSEQTSIRSTSSEPTPTATTPQFAGSTPEATPTMEPKTESTVTTTTDPIPTQDNNPAFKTVPRSTSDPYATNTDNCVEKMQSGQIEAYNECVKGK